MGQLLLEKPWARATITNSNGSHMICKRLILYVITQTCPRHAQATRNARATIAAHANLANLTRTSREPHANLTRTSREPHANLTQTPTMLCNSASTKTREAYRHAQASETMRLMNDYERAMSTPTLFCNSAFTKSREAYRHAQTCETMKLMAKMEKP